MLTVETNTLKAALECVPTNKKDPREWLHSVLIERDEAGEIFIVATSGSVLFAAKMPVSDCEQKGPWKIMVPADAVKLAVKTRSYTLRLEALPDGRYALGDVIFTALPGVFPDWRRVTPAPTSTPAPGAARLQFDPALLLQASNALDTYHDVSAKNRGLNTLTECDGNAVMHGDSEHALVVVMPVRVPDRETRWFAV